MHIYLLINDSVAVSSMVYQQAGYPHKVVGAGNRKGSPAILNGRCIIHNYDRDYCGVLTVAAACMSAFFSSNSFTIS